MIRRVFLALLACLLVAGFPLTATAEPALDTKNKGLYISPLRNYLSLSAGDTVTRSFTVANLTDTAMTVNIHVERFSMIDYSYDYSFSKVQNDWLHFSQSVLTLEPYRSQEVPYTLSLPTTAAPGGYYYSLFASTTNSSGSTSNTIQAGSLLYLTIKGKTTYDFTLSKVTVPILVTGPKINYSFDIENTGNTHYFALVSAQVDGLFYHDAPNGTSQLLMPGAIRHVAASINAPLFPGIYRLTYTIAPDHGSIMTKRQLIINAPPWSIVALFFVVLVIIGIRRRKKATSA